MIARRMRMVEEYKTKSNSATERKAVKMMVES
jgi:hypothetical protein